MDLLKGLKSPTIEQLAELWENNNFQELVKVLKLNQENYGKRMLIGRITENNWKDYRETQDLAYAFSLIIKTVESAYQKVNNIKPKRRKK